jgi:hypothetical protein
MRAAATFHDGWQLMMMLTAAGMQFIAQHAL